MLDKQGLESLSCEELQIRIERQGCIARWEHVIEQRASPY